MTDRPATEPRTEAGRALIARMMILFRAQHESVEAFTADILAIEAQMADVLDADLWEAFEQGRGAGRAEAARGAAPRAVFDYLDREGVSTFADDSHRQRVIDGLGAAPLTCQRCGHHEGCSARCCMNQAEPCDFRAAPRAEGHYIGDDCDEHDLDHFAWRYRVAPRAEGLDVERLRATLWGMKWDPDAQRFAQKIAAGYARLRPSDERPWLTIHGIVQPHRGNGLPDHIPGTYEGRCPQCPSDEREEDR